MLSVKFIRSLFVHILIFEVSSRSLYVSWAKVLEDDMLLSENSGRTISSNRNGNHLRAGLVNPLSRWRYGIVPYEISSGYNHTDIEVIKDVFKIFHNESCIRFRQRNDRDDSWIAIKENFPRCFSYVGKIGGEQTLSLRMGECVNQRIILHELMHTLGFYGEHNSHDRDKYIHVFRDHIIEGEESWIEWIANPEDSSHFGYGYDFDSIMHYPSYAFSKDGHDTIVPKDPSVDKTKLGTTSYLSEKDILKLRAMYRDECEKRYQICV
ncbi:zinc metalloproteinase nas-8-like [Chrysoperla carnea]|uniref:zinc metalloproteinase nas-8-like n=1 Tax=Chrysoperla carnea TaxID=189513 RepID=UPI001D09477A|nr:zinc metalloproteinase nas-8-like [Chrysoperla carnea]